MDSRRWSCLDYILIELERCMILLQSRGQARTKEAQIHLRCCRNSEKSSTSIPSSDFVVIGFGLMLLCSKQYIRRAWFFGLHRVFAFQDLHTGNTVMLEIHNRGEKTRRRHVEW